MRQAMLANFSKKNLTVFRQSHWQSQIKKAETPLPLAQQHPWNERKFDHHGRQLSFDRMAWVPSTFHATWTFDGCRGSQIQGIPNIILDRYSSRGLVNITVWNDADYLLPRDLVDGPQMEDPTKLYLRRQGQFIVSCLQILQKKKSNLDLIIDT
jgi:hypothetical protein